MCGIVGYISNHGVKSDLIKGLKKLDKSSYDDIIIFEKTEDLLSPFLSSVNIQIFAINLALARNLDIDKPRNLAKSVTVE